MAPTYFRVTSCLHAYIYLAHLLSCLWEVRKRAQWVVFALFKDKSSIRECRVLSLCSNFHLYDIRNPLGIWALYLRQGGNSSLLYLG